MNNQMCLEWKHLSYSIEVEQKSGEGFFKRRKKTEFQECILKEVSGCMNTGELVAVLGPSGAGKTTLLAAISQRLRGSLSGEMFLNGQHISRDEMANISGFLPQLSSPIQALTSFEHLFFLSHFKMDPATSKISKMRKINTLLETLGLKDESNMQIRFLSGGQRKRLNLVEELLTDPPFLFCDEPTTNLDSFSAFSVIQSLKQLIAQHSKSFSDVLQNDFEMQTVSQDEIYGNSPVGYKPEKGIMCSIHQPSSDVFELFTHVILLDAGKVVFYGSVDDACIFFSRLGLHCPANCNPAEFYVKVITTTGDGHNWNDIVRDNFEQESTKQCPIQSALGTAHNATKISGRRRIGWFFQLYVLVSRKAFESKRNLSEEVISIGLMMITSVVLAVFYSSVEGFKSSTVQDVEGCLFMVSCEIIFTMSYGVTNLLPTQLPAIRREVGENTYTLSAFYCAQILSSVPKIFLINFLFFGIIYATVKFSKDFWTYVSISVSLSLASLTASAYGMFLSSIFESVALSSELATPFDIIFLVTGGFYISLKSVPYLKYFSMFYYANEAIANDYWKDMQLEGCTTVESCFRNGSQVLEDYSYESHPFVKYVDYAGLFLLALIFHLLAFFGIRKHVNRYGYY